MIASRRGGNVSCPHITVVLAVVLTVLASTQATATDLESVFTYVAAHESGRERLTLGMAEAAGLVRETDKPLVIDLRPPDAFAKLHVEGARQLTLAQLFTRDELGRLPKNERILVVDDGSTQAVEAMVLLRLLGYKATAVQGGGDTLALQVARPPDGSTDSAASAAANPTSSGTEAQPAPDSTTTQPSTTSRADPMPAEPPTPATRIPPWLLAVVGALVLACVAMAIWFLVAQPRRRARPLHQAMRMLATGGDAVLQDIEALLNVASTAGLRPADLNEARFLLAYVRARLGRHPDALSVIGESIASGDTSTRVLYLDLWLKVKLQKWEEAERRWYESSEPLKKYLDGRSVAGIAFLELGRQNLTRKEYDKALACFDKVRTLGVYADHLPGHLSNLQLVLALGALFEKDAVRARQRFENVLEKAESARTSTLLPRIGLLLCRWQSEGQPDIDQPLSEIVDEVEGIAEGAKESEEAGLVAPLALWHVVSLLFQWLLLPKLQGLPDEERARLDTRLDRLRRHMPEEGDADLIAGLVDYFCTAKDTTRRTGVEAMRKAMTAGVTQPEILVLVQSEDRLAELEKNKLSTYFSLVKSYLGDAGVSIELRQELYEYLSQFKRFQNLGEVVAPAQESGVAPVLHELTSSARLLEERIRRMFPGRDENERQKEIDELLLSLNGSRDNLQQTYGVMEKVEQRLMWTAGELLLPDEPAAVQPMTGA